MGTASRVVSAVLCVLGLAGAVAAQAGAHGEASPLIRSVVEDVEPGIEGVSFTPVRGPAALVRVVNRTREDVEVLGVDGEPFLRVGPRGVFGNVRAPAWYESGNPDGRGLPGLRPGRAARWRLVGRRPVWEYFEHRLHPGRLRLPSSARAARRPVKLADFEVPFRHGGRPARVTGRVEFRPVVGTVAAALESGARPLPGVSVTLLPGTHPALLLQNVSRAPVSVLGRDGEPYARVGPRGVEINQRSPLHVEDLRRRGELPRVAADPDGAPLWRRTTPVPSFTWIEPRAAYELEQPPDPVVRSGAPVRLKSWSVPLRAGGRTAQLAGVTRWVPTSAAGVPRDDGASSSRGGGAGALPWVGLAAALALAGALVLRLRRRAGTRA